MSQRTIGSWIVLTAVTMGLPARASAQQIVVAPSALSSPADGTRLFLMPTARTLPARTALVGVDQLVMPFFDVGVTDRVTVGATVPMLGFAGGMFWATARMGVIQRDSFAAAVGVLHFGTFSDQLGGVAYASTTVGGADRAVTVTAGRVYSSDGAGPATGMIGGNWRVGRRTRFVTENHIWREGGMISAGIRYGGEKFSADFGLARPLFTNYPFFPVVNFMWRVGA
jgi:hypothetical protein